MVDYLRHAPSVIHSVTMSMVNMLLIIAVLQEGIIIQQGPEQVCFHINILDVHCDDRIRAEKAQCS